VSRANERADACACEQIHGNIIFFEDPQDADMRNPARESASQRHADARAIERQIVGERPQPFYRRPKPTKYIAHRSPGATNICPCQYDYCSLSEGAGVFRLTRPVALL